ncbi:MAG: TylF/MycF/NovP-related O-methyltransferase [Caulobacterales bacterium]
MARLISQVTNSDIAAEWALYKAIRHIVKNKIPDNIVECGVWCSGSMLLAAEALRHFRNATHTAYLYDTFAGMPKPSAQGIDNLGNSALHSWSNWRVTGQSWGAAARGSMSAMC